jgi:dienelactone hydrolase
MDLNFLNEPNPSTWPAQRLMILEGMQQVMGPLPGPEKRVPLQVETQGEEVLPAFTRSKISYATEANCRVPAYLLVPHSLQAPAPAVLCLHQTTRCGKAEPAGVDGKDNLHYAAELAERGFVTLAPDYASGKQWGIFGEYGADPYELGYVSATMKGIWDHMRAIDLLQSLPEVDGARIGCIGHSLGGHNTLFVSAFDERVKALVSCCGFTSFAKYYGGDLAGFSHTAYMPRIRSVYHCDPELMPFDFPALIASLAPRAFLAVAPLHDDNFDVTGVEDCLRMARPVYEMMGAGAQLAGIFPDCQHDFPPQARQTAYAWLERGLSRATAA